MQISQHFHRGDLVEVRRQRWRVADVRAYEACRLVTLTGVSGTNRGNRQRFLAPFDTVAPIDRRAKLRVVGAQRWRRACRALLAGHTPTGCLSVARQAQITLLPHQLEPALAVIRGCGTRVLLADDVGLGKTIQAGLMVAELQERGWIERVLIVTPAGLRDQWQSELKARFNIEATVVGAAAMRQRTACLPIGLNPWTTVPVAIASMDYIKRPEILQSVLNSRWDIVVVDEVHGLGPGSDRYAAMSAIAKRSTYVLLLTATPHHGDSRAFAALCDVGAHGDSLLVFRRTKSQVNLSTGRHIHTLHVRPTIAEARLQALLTAFARAVRAEHDSAEAWLALSVLHKRAFSSARSLGLTVERRLAALAVNQVVRSPQLALPWPEEEGEIDRTDEPPDCLDILALTDASKERRLLRGLLDAARTSARDESKIAALRRLLRRIAEPVLVFTEFRDTLDHLRNAIDEPLAILHGGLSRIERISAIDDFTSGRRRILLATDAAGEGLNLHHRCRIVVNLELPWNPVRLEQRIGRVDRIGQRRQVEVFHLVGRDTGEQWVLKRLKDRIARAAVDIQAVNPVEDERVTARCVIEAREDGTVSPREEAEDRVATNRIVVDLREPACAEAVRLTEARAWSSAADARLLAALDSTAPWIAKTRLRETRARLGSRAVAIARVEHSRGGLSESHLVAMTLSRHHPPFGSSGRLADLLDRAPNDLEAAAQSTVRQIRGESASPVSAAHVRRQQLILESIATPLAPVQSGLFDRRAERTSDRDRAALNETVEDFRQTVGPAAFLDADAECRARLLLVLVP